MQTDKHISQGWPNQTNEQLDIDIIIVVLWYSHSQRTFYCTSCAANFSPESCKSRINSVLCLNTPLQSRQDDIPNGKFQLPFLSSIFVDSFYGISYRPGNKTFFFQFFEGLAGSVFPLSQDFNSMELLVDSKDEMRLEASSK